MTASRAVQLAYSCKNRAKVMVGAQSMDWLTVPAMLTGVKSLIIFCYHHGNPVTLAI